MSGGSYNYAYGRINDLADEIERSAGPSPRRLAFVALLRLCAQAAHDIEWVDSGDYGPGDERAAIDAALAMTGGDAATLAKAAAFDRMAAMLRAVAP